MTALYQVAALIRTLDDAADSGDDFDTETMVAQVDQLIMSAIQALDGPDEAKMVRSLTVVRANLLAGGGSAGRATDVGLVKDEALRAVNDYFERRLRAVPSIAAYLDEVAAAGAG